MRLMLHGSHHRCNDPGHRWRLPLLWGIDEERTAAGVAACDTLNNQADVQACKDSYGQR